MFYEHICTKQTKHQWLTHLVSCKSVLIKLETAALLYIHALMVSSCKWACMYFLREVLI